MASARAPAHAPAHEAPEVETVRTTRVACDGGQGALGHPRVWLSIPAETGWIDCPYCDKRFVLADDAAAAH